MEYGVAFLMVLLILISYVIVQETRAQLHWRGLVQQGDLEAIHELVSVETERWRTSRVPKGTPALLWHGVQTVDLVEVTEDGARLSCNADGEYSVVQGKRVETSSPLNEGMKITKKLSEMMFYDIPNVKLDHVQVDVYTSFRDDSGRAEPRCVLSTLVRRRMVEYVDWEEIEPADFIELNEGRFAGGYEDGLKSVEPLPWVGSDSAKEN